MEHVLPYRIQEDCYTEAEEEDIAPYEAILKAVAESQLEPNAAVKQITDLLADHAAQEERKLANRGDDSSLTPINTDMLSVTIGSTASCFPPSHPAQERLLRTLSAFLSLGVQRTVEMVRRREARKAKQQQRGRNFSYFCASSRSVTRDGLALGQGLEDGALDLVGVLVETHVLQHHDGREEQGGRDPLAGLAGDQLDRLHDTVHDDVLNAGVFTLGVLSDQDRVHVVVWGLVALDALAGSHVGEQVEGTAEGQVQGDVTLADGGGEGAFEGDEVAVDGFHGLGWDALLAVDEDGRDVDRLPLDGGIGGAEDVLDGLGDLVERHTCECARTCV
ncbi:hypothetical protein D0868_04343 [Hortaea werneckii]|uniref:Uncharacterized protein n=1 Tax=Hortaea werneckii TaxID=91943 RepID=A0A3M6Z1X8_HORWE|nr:hypothetical protein D0868_04343 [Hortaea werneckii]